MGVATGSMEDGDGRRLYRAGWVVIAVLLALLLLVGCSSGGSSSGGGGGDSTGDPATETFTVSVAATPESGGTADGGGEYEEGAEVTVTAVPAAGFRLVVWREGDETVATEAEYTFTAGGGRELVAVFAGETVELSAVPKHTEIDIEWNAAEHEAAEKLTLCRATSPVDDFDNCGASGGLLIEVDGGEHTLTGLIRHRPYYLMLEADYGDGEPVLSELVAVVTSHGMNDTGITRCGNYAYDPEGDGTNHSNDLDCDETEDEHGNPVPLGQDAHQLNRDTLERDWTLAKVGGGDAGFDFTRICGNGEAEGEGLCPAGLDLNPFYIGDGDQQWACTRDNVTGLVWEVKVNDESHLRHKDHTYSWYQPDGPNMGDAGIEDGGNCEGSQCDTYHFVEAVNDQGLCGAHDWRMPTVDELLSIVHWGRTAPAIDEDYFPNTPSGISFVSDSSYAGDPELVWRVFPSSGALGGLGKHHTTGVRLVRGGQ